MSGVSRAVFAGCIAVLLPACAAVNTVGALAAKPLEYVGLLESSGEEAQAAAQAAEHRKAAIQRAAIRNVNLAVTGGPNLNVDEEGNGLALVLRFYALRDATAFQQAPFETFADENRAAEVLGADVVTVRELVLTPEQRLQSLQAIHPEVNVLGVVALFRKPAESRWRLVFDLQQAAREGIVLGANACALSVTSGLNGLDGAGLPWRLLPARCP